MRTGGDFFPVACCAPMRTAAALLALAPALIAACGGATTSASGPATTAAPDRFAPVLRALVLFDRARFGRDDAALAALSTELTGAPDRIRRGVAGTDQAIEALMLRVDEVLRDDRLHPRAVEARTLLEHDRRPPDSRGAMWQRMMQLRRIAGGADELAAAARLRLASTCVQALRDAAEAPWRHRPRIAAHCLYPLYEADPEPYFAAEPARRPPTPEWHRVIEDLRELLAAGPAWGELEPARQAMLRSIEPLAAPGVLPAEPRAMLFPAVEEAELYDFTPLIKPALRYEPANIERIAELVQADGRGRVALAVEASAERPAAAILAAARAAAAAGASDVEILVGTEQKVAVPPGDHFAGRMPDGVAGRAAVVPLSLAPLGGPDQDERSPRLLDWTVGLRLHLVVGEGAWRLVAPDGELARSTISEDTHGAGALLRALEQVRAAYPEAQHLLLVLEPDARYPVAALLAAGAARRGGAPFFRIGLAATAPVVRERGLAARVARRAAAQVAITPDALASHTGAALACYRDLVERSPALAGAVRLEIQRGVARVAGRADRRLARCATAAVADAMLREGMASAELRFTLAAP